MLLTHLFLIIHLPAHLNFPPIKRCPLTFQRLLWLKHLRVVRQGFVRTVIGLIGKEIGEQARGGIVLVHWRKAQDVVHGAQNGAKIGVAVRHIPFFHIRTSHHQYAAVGINVVLAALWVVFGDDHEHVFPVRGAG